MCATRIVNKSRAIIKVSAVKVPAFGESPKLILQDGAVLTGGQVFSSEKGMKLDKFSWDWLGSARLVTITKDTTTIVDGKGNTESIQARVEELQQQIQTSNSMFEQEKLQERLAKFVGGVAIVYVGGNTETEIKEKKDRVEDALYATKAAIEEGIVAGGGSALLYAREAITELKEESDAIRIGKHIVYQACGKPFEQILLNAGYTPNDMYPIINEIGNQGEVGTKPWFGFNIKEEAVVNMKEAGIIDPAKVTRTALENAASVAGTILLTECVIVDSPEQKKGNNNDFAGMGDMF